MIKNVSFLGSFLSCNAKNLALMNPAKRKRTKKKIRDEISF